MKYNDIEKLESIVENDEIGVIIMEPMRHQEPKNDFLKKVRKIADEINAILIIDEISAGWRMNVGGQHLLYNLKPDIAVFSKAMSNGYPMGAIIGRGDVMDAAQTSFISSTYWTERVGPTAAIATINKMLDNNVPQHLTKIGKLIDNGLNSVLKENNIDSVVLPPYPLVTFTLNYENALEIKTLFTQEMLKRSILATQSVYVSYSHNEDHVNNYISNVSEVFEIISDAIEHNNVKDKLEGPVCHSGFQRLT